MFTALLTIDWTQTSQLLVAAVVVTAWPRVCLKAHCQPWCIARREFLVTRNYWMIVFGFFEIWYLFERLRLSIRKKKLSSIRTSQAIRGKKCHLFQRFGLTVRRKLSPFEGLEVSVQNNRPFGLKGHVASIYKNESYMILPSKNH